MDRLVKIETTGAITSAIFKTKDVAEVNMLRRAILSEIESYAIDIVIFQTNTSPRHDEIIALRLGQLVIDHSRFVPPAEGDTRVHVDFQGPGVFTTTHIPLPFKYVTPIVTLKTGQRIVCDLIVKRGQGKHHVKWRPVSVVTMMELEEGYKITLKDIGMFPGPEIFEKGFAKMADTARQPPINIFSHPLVSNNI